MTPSGMVSVHARRVLHSLVSHGAPRVPRWKPITIAALTFLKTSLTGLRLCSNSCAGRGLCTKLLTGGRRRWMRQRRTNLCREEHRDL